jgi:uncharacterized protein (DUF58 family)
MSQKLPFASLEGLDLRALSARAQGWAEVFRLPFGKRVWRGAAGDRQGSGTGSSLDFQDHRAYLPGDDPRHINWQAYARSGNYTMKLYREEVRPLVDLVVDVSPSMFLGDAKAARVVELLYFLVHAILKSGASGRFYLVGGGGSTPLRPEELTGHSWPARAVELPAGPASSAPRLEGIPFRARSMRLLLSDLLFQGDNVPVLRQLAHQRGFGSIFAPYSKDEAEPAWSGNYEFVDAEDGTRHPRRVPVDVLQRYRAAYRRHFEQWKQEGRRHDVAVVRVPAEAEFALALRLEAVTAGCLDLA